MGSLKLFRIKQFVSQDFCLSCLGCCRYNCNPSIWTPNLLGEEKKALKLQKLELIAHKEFYICCFLNPKDNRCRIYNQRPLECRLYPFLLNHCESKIYLSLDLKCPATSGKISSKEFKRYLNYLIRHIKKTSVLTILNKNLKIFHSYPAGEVLNLAELTP